MSGAAGPGALFERLPEGLAEAFDPERPWELLGEPLAALLDALPSDDLATPPGPDVHLLGDRIVIGPGARLLPGAVIEGPVRIGADAVVRPGAYLRGGCWIGDGCVIGASVEVKRSILLDGARIPHLSYVGDSILGAGVNLGAGTVLSNFRFDGREIRIRHGTGVVETGRRKLGAVLGDGVQTGCNCVLSPGTVVGAGSWVYPGVVLPAGVYPGGLALGAETRLTRAARRGAPKS